MVDQYQKLIVDERARLTACPEFPKSGRVIPGSRSTGGAISGGNFLFR